MDAVSKITLNALDGSKIEITYKTNVSEYDTEQVESVLLPAMRYNPETKKAEVNYDNVAMFANQRVDKMIAVFVTGWNRDQAYTPDEIKKVLARGEFRKLTDALDKVYEGETLDSKKKESSPNNLSEPSSTPTNPSPGNSDTIK